MTGKLRIGLIGCGTIGTRIAQAIDQGEIPANLFLINDLDIDKARLLISHLEKQHPAIVDAEELFKGADLVIEAASRNVVPRILHLASEYRKDCMIMSVGGLLGAEDLIKAIRAVNAGESVLHTAVARKVTDYFARRSAGTSTEGLVELTDREMEVLRLAAQGNRNRDIADLLTISIRTVQVHMGNIFSKLGVASRTEAVLYALREGWLSLEDTL